MKITYTKYVLAAALLMCHCAARAEDIDLFVNRPASSQLPNVLFIVDNTANWSQAFTNEIAALVGTFNNLLVNSDGSAIYNVGVMFSAETGNPNNNVAGGYVRAAIRPMTAANKAKYAAMFAALDKNADKGNGGQSSLVMAEAYRYFSAGLAYAGNFKAKADYAGNTTGSAAMQAIYALPGNALSAFFAASYNSPIASGCAKNFIIYISNGAPQDNNSVITQATTMLSDAGGNVTPIPVSPSGSQGNVSDEWARFMNQSSLGVVTYTIDVDPAASGQGPGWTALLNKMASVSSGKYAWVNSTTGSAQIANAINNDLSEIQAVNSVFASVSLPVSVNTQGTYLNQVYVGMFRPDASALPRWNGNLKQYKIGETNGVLELDDADNVNAINNNTGFITECARSFWTPTSTDSYWAFKPQSGCIPPVGSATDLYLNSNKPDGNVVEKGAQGYMLRSTTTRTVKTCSPIFASCTSLVDFNTANSAITQALLGASSTTERTALINWAHGLDVDDEDQNGVTTAETRPSAHGDVVHSRPAAINFGTDTSPQVVVFYGGNDGVFRAINGNRTANIGTVTAGSELWAFIPPEFYGSIKRLRDDTTLISYPNITDPTALPKPYGIDGAITAYKDSSNAWIYAGMRRGGRALYAFNVDVTNPSNITLKWKVGCPNNFVSGTVDDSNCTTGFTGIGQTWSSAKTLLAAGYSSGSSPLIIMGGGYDTCEDANPNTCTSSSKGHKIYVLDANNGNLLNTLNTDRGVVADLVVVPDSTTGLAKYAYAADLGGNIYRVDIGTNAPANWTITKIASLGCDTTASCSYNRKFMFAPDYVVANGIYDLLLGSGDREKPTLTNSGVNNYFFMVKDNPTNGTWLSTESSNCGSSVLCLNSLVGITTSATPSTATLTAKKGWYLGLSADEQVVTSAITIFGVVTFSTHQPTPPQAGVCTSNLGTARVYNVSYLNAATENGTGQRYEVDSPNTGLPASPVAGTVALDDGTHVTFCIGCTKCGPECPNLPPPPPGSTLSQPKGRVYWYIQRQ
jgi:type IV pilus assembly protein PilY1